MKTSYLIKASSVIAVIAITTSCTIYSKPKKDLQNPSFTTTAQNPNRSDIKSFFSGNSSVTGIVQDKSGAVVQVFKGSTKSSWDENRATIQESITYGDGKKDGRTFLVTLNNNGTLNIVVHDLVGQAYGSTNGNVTSMFYALSNEDGPSKTVSNYNRMIYLLDDNSAISVTESNSDAEHRRISFFTKEAAQEKKKN